MLDDCVLNNSEFGYIAGNIDGGSENGWSLPAEYGVLTSAENLQEQGTNLMFTAYGEKRFRVMKIIPAALSAEDFGDVFPSCLLYTSPSPRDAHESRMPSSA